MGILDFLFKKSAGGSTADAGNAHDKNGTSKELTGQDLTMNVDQDKEPLRPQSTPDNIYRLHPDEVFVFGSNLRGFHQGGAARAAMHSFGAVGGQGVGLQGQSYAIPTMQGGVETIKPYVDEFIRFAREHSELYFYVTRIGCGIAGFRDKDIAPLFTDAVGMENVILPASFIRVIDDIHFPELSRLAQLRLHQHGQTRTLADIAMALNEKCRFKDLRRFFAVFDKTIEEYRERGTVSADVCLAFKELVIRHEAELFGSHRYLDFDNLVRIIDNADTGKEGNTLDTIYSWREKTKLLRLAALLNEIVHYTDADSLANDLAAIATGRFECGDMSMMNDSFRYPLHFFRMGVSKLWDEIQENGYMSNKLLEEKMFTEHEKKVRKLGLDKVLEEDFRHGSGCHPDIYVPHSIGTAPVYLKDYSYNEHCTGFGSVVKSCGNGKGPDSCDSLYEMRLVEPILRRECTKGTYCYKDGHYYPIRNLRKPVFREGTGILRFDLWYDKRDYIWSLMTEGQREDYERYVDILRKYD